MKLELSIKEVNLILRALKDEVYNIRSYCGIEEARNINPPFQELIKKIQQAKKESNDTKRIPKTDKRNTTTNF